MKRLLRPLLILAAPIVWRKLAPVVWRKLEDPRTKERWPVAKRRRGR